MATSNTERLGVNAVERLFLSYGWIFREQHVQDFGVDALVEMIKEGCYPSGQLIALQIKSGQSFFTEETDRAFVFRPDSKHVEYWQNHAMPVLVLIYHPERDQIFWQQVTAETVQSTGKGWRFEIPKAHLLERDRVPRQFYDMWQPEPYIRRLNRLRVDIPWMRMLKAGVQVVMQFDDWVHKSLPRFQVTLFGGGHRQSWPTLYAAGRSIEDMLEHFIPWADYESDEEAYREFMVGQWDAECYMGRNSETGTVYHSETFDEWYTSPTEKLFGEELGGEVVRYRLLLSLNEFGETVLAMDDFLETTGPMEKGTFTVEDLEREASLRP